MSKIDHKTFFTIVIIFSVMTLLSLPVFAGEQVEVNQIDFADRIQVAHINGIVDEPGWSYWGSSIVKHDGRYYCFAARWKDGEFWGKNSEIMITAPSNSLYGPYVIKRNLSPVLKSQAWASNWVHNPTVYRFQDMYYLFYVGHDGSLDHRQVGVATSLTPEGPWIPFEGNPILRPRRKQWDSFSTTNIAVYRDCDGKYLMLYKGRTEKKRSQRIGIAEAKNPIGPWTGRTNAPNFSPQTVDIQLEDVCAWKEGGFWWALVKSFERRFDVPPGCGVLFRSKTGKINTWNVHSKPLGYRRSIRWEGSEKSLSYKNVERPFVYTENGVARALTNAVSKKGTKFDGMNVIRKLVP